MEAARRKACNAENRVPNCHGIGGIHKKHCHFLDIKL
jgi:hypothetical protein